MLRVSAEANPSCGSTVGVAGLVDASGGNWLTMDERLGRKVGLVIRHLHGRMLAEKGRWRFDRTTLAPVQRYLGAADHVDRHAGAVGAVLDRQTKLEVHRHVA